MLSLLRSSLAATALLAAAALLAPAAKAEPLDLKLSYEVSLAEAGPAITNIITFNHTVGGGGAWWASEVPAGVTGWTIDDPFLKSSTDRPLDGLMLGLVQDLPGDAPGQKHVVMMMSDDAAAAAAGVAWGTLFRNTNEAAIIAAIELATSGLPFDIIDPAFEVLGDFTEGDATNGILSAGGESITSWFSLAAPVLGQTTTSRFTVMAFSNGRTLGTGVASVTQFVLPAEVPEPGTAVLAACALLLAVRQGQRPRAGVPA